MCEYEFQAYSKLDKKFNNKLNFCIYIKEWVQSLDICYKMNK